MSFQNIRGKNYSKGYHAIEDTLKSGASSAETLQITMPALSNLGTAYATLGTVKDDMNVDMAAGGQPILYRDTNWVILGGDLKAAQLGVGYLKAETVELLVDASTTPVIGDIAYIIPVATASVGGCVSPAATTGYYRIGVFKSAKYTNPTGRPAGSYALVSFDGTHNEIVP